MIYTLGFDGGGSKTECVVLNADGVVVGTGHGGPSNLLRSGYDAAFQSLSEAAAEALKKGGLDAARITGVCAGLAGASGRTAVRRVLVFLAHGFPRALAHVTSDCEIALEAAAGNAPGVVLISGTGSVAFGRNAKGEIARAGGYGPWIGDEGSAFDIGRRAMVAVARARDQAGQETLLTEMVPAALKCPDWNDLVQRTMKTPDDIFPQLFACVTVAADAGDRAAQEILLTSAIALGNLAMSVVRRLGMTDEEFPLIKCGGVFRHSKMLNSLLDSNLEDAPRAQLSFLQTSAAVGAARMAARLSESLDSTARSQIS